MFSLKLEKNRFILSIFLFVFVLFLSLLLFFLQNKGRIEYRMFFVDNRTNKVISERRVVPFDKNREKKIEYFVNEFLSGSVNQSFRKTLFPLECKVAKVVLDTENKTLYLDLPANVLFADASGSIDIYKSIDLLKRNVKSNFNGLKHIFVSVGGENLLEK